MHARTIPHWRCKDTKTNDFGLEMNDAYEEIQSYANSSENMKWNGTDKRNMIRGD